MTFSIKHGAREVSVTLEIRAISDGDDAFALTDELSKRMAGPILAVLKNYGRTMESRRYKEARCASTSPAQ